MVSSRFRLYSLRAQCCALFCLLLLAASGALAQSPQPASVHGHGSEDAISTRPFSHFAIGVNGGTMGVGVEVATVLSRRTNLRVDGDFFNYSTTLEQDGVTYTPQFKLRNARAMLDVYPFHGGFRISVGGAAYNQFDVNATASVPGGHTVTLNDVDYYSSASDPLHGSASLTYPHKYAGVATIGWGNAIPRSGRHFAFPVEIGAAFTGTPTFALSMAGSACATTDPLTCLPVTSYPDFQTHLTAEQQKIQKDINPFRVYPILQVGVTYRF